MARFTYTLLLGLAALLMGAPVNAQDYEKFKGTQLSRTKVSFKDIEEADKLYPELKPTGRRINNKMDILPDIPIDEADIVFQAPKTPLAFLNPQKDPSPAPDADFLGLEDSGGSIPPDVNGAPGLDHLMVTLNTDFRIMDKQGNPISTVSAGSFWQSAPGAGGTFDPKISYDPYENRWLLVMPSSSDPNFSKIMIAVSENHDPTGNWYIYGFDGDPENNHWFDYPNYGFNKDKLVVTGNMFGGGGFYASLYVFSKEDLYNNALEVEYTRFKVYDGSTLVPAKTYDTEEDDIYVINNAGGSNGGYGYVRLKKVTGPPEDPEIVDIGLSGVPEPWSNSSQVSAGNFAPQLDSDERINTVDARMENMVYRNGKLWAAHHVYLPAGNNPQRSAIQWWNLSTDGEVLQWGRVDDPDGGMFFAFASIAVNAMEDVLIGFGSFSEAQYASSSYAMRYAEDPPNTLREYYQYRDGEAPYFKTFGADRNRWGDYTSTFVDPEDDLDFWTLQEYAAMPAGVQDEWGTWWAYLDMHAVPEADFTSNIDEVPVNSGVDFYDQSKYNPDTWLWTFEGGTPSTSVEQNPQNIIYNEPGMYDVTLIATNGEGSNMLVMENFIDANTTIMPEVDFTSGDTIICLGETVQFNDMTVYNPVSWLWAFKPDLVTFMNGTDETSQHPQVQFDYPYVYEVTLTATNNNGSASLTKKDMIRTGGIPLPFIEDFESRSFNTNNWSIENPDDDKTWDLQFVAGQDQGEMAAYMNIKNYGGLYERDRLISPKLNFYAHKDIVLEFQFAYRQRMSAYTDSLIVLISEDCGMSWTRLLAMAEDLEPERVFATSEPSANEFIPAVGSDWCGSENNPECVSIDLSAYSGKPDVSIMFESYNSYGNNMFIDNIVIDGTIIGTEETAFEGNRIILFPNPSKGLITASFADTYEYCLLSVFTIDGTRVYSAAISNPGIEQIDLSGLTAGIYLVELKTEAGRTLEKVVLQ
jgi:PKD repeat protein